MTVREVYDRLSVAIRLPWFVAFKHTDVDAVLQAAYKALKHAYNAPELA